MKLKMVITAMLGLMLVPAVAFAHAGANSVAQGPTAHARPTLYHDRSPRLRERGSTPHR